jgi:hypothetical protein
MCGLLLRDIEDERDHFTIVTENYGASYIASQKEYELRTTL